MSVSKRLRYEVLRRDNHQCRYCGGAAPEVPLTVDHVIPVALGASNEPSNLVTACGPCNSGKSASSPDAPIVADVAADALRWSKAMEQAAEQLDADHELRERRREQFKQLWDTWTIGDQPVPLPAGWEDSIDRFISAGLPLHQVTEAVRISMTRHVPADAVFNYFCGVCWNKVTEMQERARGILTSEALDASDDDDEVEDQDDSWPGRPLSPEWDAFVARWPDLAAVEAEAIQVAQETRLEHPEFDPLHVWYGYADWSAHYGLGIKHNWAGIAEVLKLSAEDEAAGYQHLNAVVRWAWNGAGGA